MQHILGAIERANASVNRLMWGPFMLVAFLGVGLALTIRSGGFQIKGFRLWMGAVVDSFRRDRVARDGAISPFQALTTALAGTVGTGNIVGVASAVALGGPGAVFWMWVSAALGMMTGYAEKALCIKYRTRNAKGEWVGGPMAYIERGLGSRRLAMVYALCCAMASLGIGNMVQANAVSGVMRAFHVHPAVSGLALSALVGLVIIGGIRRIGAVTEKLVPAMAALYTIGCVLCVAANARAVPGALRLILSEAFRFRAAAGGAAGYGIAAAMRVGISRGVFSNEAGLGSSAIAHAAADTDEPARQGMWGMFEVFVDTIVMCTLTALVILTSDAYDMNATQRMLTLGGKVPLGAELTVAAMGGVLGDLAQWMVGLSLLLFAVSTMIGWSYYGERSVAYLVGDKGIAPYRALFVAAVFAGAVVELGLVWGIADTMNGLMAIPNLIAVFALSGEAIRMLDRYKAKLSQP